MSTVDSVIVAHAVYVLYILLQVDYGSTAEELEAHFHGCGAVSRVTILCDKFTGHPKGLTFCHVLESLSTSLLLLLCFLFCHDVIHQNDFTVECIYPY